MATVFINGEATEIIKDADDRDVFNLEDVNVRQSLRTEVQQQNAQLEATRNLRDDKVILRDTLNAELAELNAEIQSLNTEITTIRDQRDANVAYLQGKGDAV